MSKANSYWLQGRKSAQTTENGVDHISRALHAGASEYIKKPFDRENARK
jgi:response regulator of citrate/malate metabolism